MKKKRALKQDGKKSKVVAVVVAHPDDETLWAGGTILCHPEWHLFIACLCRASDRERAGKFHSVLNVLKAEGAMGDLDDGPEQKDLDEKEVEQNILALLPNEHFDLIISHNPAGEYTRHRRHEETGKAVVRLWNSGRISANELWTFAYQDGNKAYYPRPEENAAVYKILPERIWMRKYQVITQIYGFEINSWEAGSVTKAEAFCKFTDPKEAEKLLNNRGSDS